MTAHKQLMIKGIAKLRDLEDIPESLISRMKKKFPDGNYSIIINLWTNSIYKVECKHAEPKDNGFIIHIWQYYKGKYSYATTPTTHPYE